LAPTRRGQVPVLQDGEITLYESGAIVECVLERYGGGRLQPSAAAAAGARGPSTCSGSSAARPLGKHLSEIMRHRFTLPEAERNPAVLADARARFAAAPEVVDRALAGRAFVCGPELTAADVMLAYAPALAKITGELPPTLANLAASVRRLRERPAYAERMGLTAHATRTFRPAAAPRCQLAGGVWDPAPGAGRPRHRRARGRARRLTRPADTRYLARAEETS
jgi:glutathione S-transferase